MEKLCFLVNHYCHNGSDDKNFNFLYIFCMSLGCFIGQYILKDKKIAIDRRRKYLEKNENKEG